jgi:hypothetical protein
MLNIEYANFYSLTLLAKNDMRLTTFNIRNEQLIRAATKVKCGKKVIILVVAVEWD